LLISRDAAVRGGMHSVSVMDKLSGAKFFSFFFSSRRRHTRFSRDWSSDVCSSALRGMLDARDTDRLTVYLSEFHPSDLADLLARSEERRVGKECRSRGSQYQEQKKEETGEEQKGKLIMRQMTKRAQKCGE